MNVWKLNIKTAANADKDPKQFCLDRGIMGIGWAVWTERDTLTKKQYLKAARTHYCKGGKKFPAAINAMVNRVKIGDLVWLRDNRNEFWLGRVISGWRYQSRIGTDDEYDQNDIHNIRDVEWHKVGQVDAVPWGIVKQFSRGTLSGMGEDADSMLRFSQVTYNRIVADKNLHYEVEQQESTGIFSYIGPDDCEDVVALYLQEKLGYRLLPSTCKPTTKHYEFVLVHPDGHRAVAQVKNGADNLWGNKYVDLKEIKNEGKETRIYLFTTKGTCDNNGHENVICLQVEKLETFLRENPNLWSQRIKTWMGKV